MSCVVSFLCRGLACLFWLDRQLVQGVPHVSPGNSWYRLQWPPWSWGGLKQVWTLNEWVKHHDFVTHFSPPSLVQIHCGMMSFLFMSFRTMKVRLIDFWRAYQQFLWLFFYLQNQFLHMQEFAYSALWASSVQKETRCLCGGNTSAVGGHLPKPIRMSAVKGETNQAAHRSAQRRAILGFMT